jgi:Ca-activated chloride channel family protein
LGSTTPLLDCYEKGWARGHGLEGSITVKLVIDRSGGSSGAQVSEATLPDRGVVSCVETVMKNVSFPQPEGGIVHVSYTLDFKPNAQLATVKPTAP